MKKVSLKTTTSSRFHLIKPTLITLLLVFVSSCSRSDDQPSEPMTGISEEIKDLIYFKGDENASKVLINVQGGPGKKLSTQEVDDFFESYESLNILAVNVHQAQTLDSSIVKGDDITFDQAVRFNTESLETLSKVIAYFKGQGRTVYVLGISFGAFLTQEFIVKNGIDSADEFLIMTGRLDMNEVMWQALAEGRYGFFENGVTPIIDTDPDGDLVERNFARISAALGMNRYTQLLNRAEDLTNVTYIYGKTDQAVGSLTVEEVQFLESKNARIITGNGGHDSTYYDFIEQGLKEAFGIE